jgi:hypothetical protein
MRFLPIRFLLIALLAAANLALATCAPPPRSEPAIWRIADADSEIWLFGSVHVLKPGVRWRGPRLDAAFTAAEELVTETDTRPEATAIFAQLAAQHGGLAEGETLSSLLGAGDAERLTAAARALGIDPNALERQRPWLTALQLSLAYAMRAGHRPEAGVEAVLSQDARRRGLRLSFLETPEQQIRVLADLSPQDELHFLRLTLRDIDRGEAVLDAMDQIWARGDVAELDRLLAQEWTDVGPTIHEALILRRNRDWTNQIEARLAGGGRIFIAVGVAHLVGEGSVVALLRERGIAVEGP